jgi:hypothetical protein
MVNHDVLLHSGQFQLCALRVPNARSGTMHARLKLDRVGEGLIGGGAGIIVPPLRFVDFSIRAWREGPYLQVLAHSTPVGGMRQPVAVKVGEFDAADFRIPLDASLADGAAVGRRLARLVLPGELWRMLGESLQVLAKPAGMGLRLRLCLDDDLIDLPWEFLYRPDVEAPSARGGFVLMDGRVSLVREPPSVIAAPVRTDRVQRGLFLGTLFDDGSDAWAVVSEHASLVKAISPLKRLLTLDFLPADASDDFERRLAEGCDVLHYAGHTEVHDGRAALVQRARADLYAADSSLTAGEELEVIAERASWAWSDNLALRLARAGTKLAVFNACNSGFWPFVRPLMRAGIPAVIGVQGLVSNLAALNFAEKLYQSLAVGLSLDEALTYARLYVAEPARSYHDCDWGRFMAYMQTDSAVLFPRSDSDGIRTQQQGVRAARARTIEGLAQVLDGEGVSRMLSEIASRSVLILGRFTAERKAVLDAIRRQLATPPRQYIPVLFDFEKPGNRDLIETIVQLASVSRFVIADLSEPKSLPAELQAIVPQFPSLPVAPIIEAGEREYAVADHILRRQSVRPVVPYRDEAHLTAILDSEILRPAEKLREELMPRALEPAG